MAFQEILSIHNSQVQTVRKTLRGGDVITAFADHWQFILTDINYVPIFRVARNVLLGLSSGPDVNAALRDLAKAALYIVGQRAALRHDLMGRIYHQLLEEAKYLGTYYTSVPAATLLLKLALDPESWPVDWSDLEEMSDDFRVVDFACGTGTLLMAAAEALADNYVRECGSSGDEPKLSDLHQVLIEDVIYGYDVLPSALHLTASTLAIRAPEVSFHGMRLYSMPHGGTHKRLGSIEFLRDRDVAISVDLFGLAEATEQVTGAGDVQRQTASAPDIDLCVMNPPFTRSVGGNLLFGSLPAAERAPMQKELSRLLKVPGVLASATAGLGSVFVAIGDKYLKEGGRMALVLPKALLSGVAWGKTRALFGLRYRLEYLICSHDPERWNFSDNTSLSEVLVIGRKVDDGEADAKVVCVNLWKNPTTAFEALAIAQALSEGTAPDITGGQGALEIRVGDRKLGEAVRADWVTLKENLWMPPCAFAQAELVRAASQLEVGTVTLPGQGTVGNVPLVPLKGLGVLGPDRRDIHDGFNLANGKTTYPALWGHDATAVTTMAAEPNSYLAPLAKAKEGRPLRKVTVLWPRAGRILLAERLWLKTQRAAAVRMKQKVLSNVWWPLSLHADSAAAEKSLVLWWNSTLGLLVMLAHREETRGAWIDFKKPVLEDMPVLDVVSLSPKQRDALAKAYDNVCKGALLPFPEMHLDPVRKAADDAISAALGLPDLSPLREMLAREPVVCLEPLT
ncbi:MAG: N-6 DNA methylase [Chloroflexi bacterium]|nr:N-6 DNA methylase [Chloroflexota bacterium]